MFIKKFIGDRAFYRSVLAVSVPMMIQQGITNFVSLLDNIMVGRLGTESMSGVSIVNQFIFIFNLLIFGAISAAGIFTAQYHGLGDVEGERHTFRFKFIINVVAVALGIAVFAALDEQLISLFLHAGSAEGDLELTLAEGKKYLAVSIPYVALMAASRNYFIVHYPTDVIAGAIVGTLGGIIAYFITRGIYHALKKRENSKFCHFVLNFDVIGIRKNKSNDA
jgi:Na+-driven multidrug efflux pump